MGRQKRLIILLDSGDTIIDEGSEIKSFCGHVLHARCIPGAKEALSALHDEGFTLALVADGYTDSFERVFRQNGMRDWFAAVMYSEFIDSCKPDPRMFAGIRDRLGITDADFARCIMVGNNLRRDVRGANGVGIASVFLDWTPRYPKEPRDESEIPRYTIHAPDELPALAHALEQRLQRGLPI